MPAPTTSAVVGGKVEGLPTWSMCACLGNWSLRASESMQQPTHPQMTALMLFSSMLFLTRVSATSGPYSSEMIPLASVSCHCLEAVETSLRVPRSYTTFFPA